MVEIRSVYEIFDEVSTAARTMAVGMMRRMRASHRDATNAYLQALLDVEHDAGTLKHHETMGIRNFIWITLSWAEKPRTKSVANSVGQVLRRSSVDRTPCAVQCRCIIGKACERCDHEWCKPWYTFFSITALAAPAPTGDSSSITVNLSTQCNSLTRASRERLFRTLSGCMEPCLNQAVLF